MQNIANIEKVTSKQRNKDLKTIIMQMYLFDKSLELVETRLQNFANVNPNRAFYKTFLVTPAIILELVAQVIRGNVQLLSKHIFIEFSRFGLLFNQND